MWFPAARSRSSGCGGFPRDLLTRGVADAASRQRIGIGAGNGQQQAAGGLGVKQDGPDFFWNVRLIADQAFGKFTVVLEASGNEAAADADTRPGRAACRNRGCLAQLAHRWQHAGCREHFEEGHRDVEFGCAPD